jgi:hypothetical protein
MLKKQYIQSQESQNSLSKEGFLFSLANLLLRKRVTMTGGQSHSIFLRRQGLGYIATTTEQTIHFPPYISERGG